MDAHTTLTPTADVDLTAIMERDGIETVRRWPLARRYSVTLVDGRNGVGVTVGEALAKALKADAENIRRAA